MNAITTRPANAAAGTHRQVWLTWAVLAASTVLTTWVFTSDALSARWALVATFAVVGWKVWLVLVDFVEFRHAPLGGRLIFYGWASVVPLGIIVLAWPS